MKFAEGNYFNIGRRPTLTLALLIALILGGNGLVILQFQRARFQTNRLTGVSQQLIAVLRLQESLQSFHHRLDELVKSKDAHRLAIECQQLRTALLEQTHLTRTTLAYLGSEFHMDVAFLTALNSMEITLPIQLQDLIDLSAAGDWAAVRLHLDYELGRIEETTSAHVNSLNRDLDEELPLAIANMKDVQRRILLIVPATAISTVFIAALFGWTMARRMWELRVEERVNERTRLARELHDTLLQSFQAALMKFSALTYLIPERPDIQEKLGGIVEQARQAVAEGRNAVLGLRSSALVTNDLARSISALGEQLAADQTGGNTPEFHVAVDGTSQELAPIVRDEVNRIAGEALRNAFQHARAKQIGVAIHYDKRRLRLRVRDDGQGIDLRVLEEGRRTGHYGMPGMRERAELLGGKLAVWSEPNSGTEIELTISAAIAYAKSPDARRSTSAGPGAP
jgi:signal transduction histidine kinase